MIAQTADTWRRRTTALLAFERVESRLAMAGAVINESLADDVSGIVDQDGARFDRVELKNTDAASVDLTGWYLTDDATNLTNRASSSIGDIVDSTSSRGHDSNCDDAIEGLGFTIFSR